MKQKVAPESNGGTQKSCVQLANGKSSENDVMIMSNYFSCRDINFKEVKYMYKSELLGPSLKRMEVNKRVSMAQQLWKQNSIPNMDNFSKAHKRKILEDRTRNDERETLMNFLDPNYRNLIINKKYQLEDDHNTNIKQLENKLDQFLNDSYKK